jgi:hypothetical protein
MVGILTLTSAFMAFTTVTLANPLAISAAKLPKPPAWSSADQTRYPIPAYERTCESDADVALMIWRDFCDRNPFSHMNLKCYGRAPSAKQCCEDGHPLDKVECQAWWPSNERTAAICGKDCDNRVDGYCHYDADIDINNPKYWCECRFQKCKVNEKLLSPENKARMEQQQRNAEFLSIPIEPLTPP